METMCINENSTVIEMMNKIKMLEQENEQLKTERDNWKFNCELLHNKIEQRYEENEKANNNGEGGWTEEAFDIASEGWYKEYDNYSLKKVQ
jgi:hypothetical protein